MNTNYLNYNSLFSAYEDYLQQFIDAGLDVEANITSFTAFLKYNQLSTIHTEELFAIYQNPKAQVKVSKHDFKLRKQHAKRDALIKKILIPATVVGSLVGSVAGAVGASGLVAGSRMFGILPVTSNFLVNFTSAAIPGFALGAVATTGVILTKNYLTRLYYKARYGSAKKSINDLNNGIEYEDLAIAKLIEKVEATNQRIMELKTGSNNIFARAWRGIRRNTLNAVNRNRIHHLEAYTKDLVQEFDRVATSEGEAKQKLAELKPIYFLLQNVETFIQNDIQASKLFNLLTCKEKKGHTHKDFIENLDIYSKLAMYLDSVDMLNPSTKEDQQTKKTQLKTYKTNKKNVKHQNAIAERLLNGENLLQRCAKRYQTLDKEAKAKKTVKRFITKADGSIDVYFDDDTMQTFTDVENIEKVQSVEVYGQKLIINYEDETSAEKSMVAKKPNKDIAAERTILRNLSASSFVEELKVRGFEDEKIEELRKELESRLKPTKKPKKLYGTPTFKNGNFADIYSACINIINTTKGLAV